jgi:transmembrane sensor
MNEEELIALVTRYHDGNATDEEKRWVEAYFDQLNPTLNLSDYLPQEQLGPAGDRLFGKIKARIDQKPVKAKVRKIAMWRYTAAAAVLLGIITISMVFMLRKKQPEAWAEMVVLHTQPGKMSKIKLSDGTLVWLNADSRLRYPQNFGGAGSREVYLDGEAYFEVAKDKEHPFRVHSKSLVTRVLGTKFNVKAYSDNKNVEVTLLEGRVMLTVEKGTREAHGHDTVYLQPNEKALFDTRFAAIAHPVAQDQVNTKSKTISGSIDPTRQQQNIPVRKITDGNAELAAAWRDGDIRFRDEPLSSVIATLNRRYNVRIHVHQNQLSTPINMNMARSPVETVLLEVAKQLRVQDNDDKLRDQSEGQIKRVGNDLYLN